VLSNHEFTPNLFSLSIILAIFMPEEKVDHRGWGFKDLMQGRKGPQGRGGWGVFPGDFSFCLLERLKQETAGNRGVSLGWNRLD
jgi:hypothetical protein